MALGRVLYSHLEMHMLSYLMTAFTLKMLATLFVFLLQYGTVLRECRRTVRPNMPIPSYFQSYKKGVCISFAPTPHLPHTLSKYNTRKTKHKYRRFTKWEIKKKTVALLVHERTWTAGAWITWKQTVKAFSGVNWRWNSSPSRGEY